MTCFAFWCLQKRRIVFGRVPELFRRLCLWLHWMNRVFAQNFGGMLGSTAWRYGSPCISRLVGVCHYSYLLYVYLSGSLLLGFWDGLSPGTIWAALHRLVPHYWRLGLTLSISLLGSQALARTVFAGTLWGTGPITTAAVFARCSWFAKILSTWQHQVLSASVCDLFSVLRFTDCLSFFSCTLNKRRRF